MGDLSKEQLETIRATVAQALGYLNRLKMRMEGESFPTHDPLCRLVVDAEDKLHGLHVALHYLVMGDYVDLPKTG